MKKSEFYFDSRDGGTRIHAVRYEPEEQALKDGMPVAILQVIHGMAEYVERYEEMAEFFTRLGFVVTGEDHLGHGGSVTEGNPFGYFCKQDPATVVVRDVHRLKKMTQQLYPGVPYFILGHSMGSFMLRNYICRYGSGIQGAVIMSTGHRSQAQLRCVKALADQRELMGGGKTQSPLIHKLIFGSVNKKVEKPKTENDWLSRNPENVAKYNADEKCGFLFTANGFATLLELMIRCGRKENLENIPKELPVMFVAGDMDPIGDYGVGVKAAYDSLDEVGMEHLTLKFYEGDRHEILHEDDRAQVMQDIYSWICAKLPKAGI